jgi:hypothetical protein
MKTKTSHIVKVKLNAPLAVTTSTKIAVMASASER